MIARKPKPDLSMIPCPCGCGAVLSRADFGRHQWLTSLSGDLPIGKVNLTARPEETRHRTPPEPMTDMRCHSCGDAFQLFTFLAEFLGKWGMERPRCEDCNNLRRERADEPTRRFA